MKFKSRRKTLREDRRKKKKKGVAGGIFKMEEE